MGILGDLCRLKKINERGGVDSLGEGRFGTFWGVRHFEEAVLGAGDYYSGYIFSERQKFLPSLCFPPRGVVAVDAIGISDQNYGR